MEPQAFAALAQAAQSITVISLLLAIVWAFVYRRVLTQAAADERLSEQKVQYTERMAEQATQFEGRLAEKDRQVELALERAEKWEAISWELVGTTQAQQDITGRAIEAVKSTAQRG